MGIVYLVRHGQSEANRLRIWGGDFPLSDKGREQALTVPAKLDPAPDRVISSTLKRANETACIAYPDMDVIKDKAFDEVRFGTMELQPMDDEEKWYLFCNDPERLMQIVKGDDLKERTETAIDAIRRYAAENAVTAIFASDTLIRCIVAALRGQTLNSVHEYYLLNCGFVKLNVEDEITLEYTGDLVLRPAPKNGERL